eukprot:Phypoly_transcript_04270.p1 GENE.Phypoly_transcript_04270~~Phypoly_transcript_04270.p1  ORF type:complete len:739 (+),score=165.83 Phypoly_transcript_04270:244-2217(+)
MEIDMKTKILHLFYPSDIKLEIKYEETFHVSEKRKQIDEKCGVSSLPLSPNPFDCGEYGDKPLTQLEKYLIKASAAIREKPDWETKYKNSEITRKWKSELPGTWTDDEFKFLMDELAYYETLQHGAIKPATVQGVWQADGLVPEDLRKELLAEVSKLENVPSHEKDWHPGSDNQVLDLVHPSLFCYVAGVTADFEDPDGHPPFKFIGGGNVDPKKELMEDVELLAVRKMVEQLKKQLEGHEEANKTNDDVESQPTKKPKIDQAEITKMRRNLMDMQRKIALLANRRREASAKYQWLPTDFQVSKDGKVSFLSYINNLDPRKHQKLYRILEKILEGFLPMYERVLNDLSNPRPLRYLPDSYSWYNKPKDTKKEEKKDGKKDEKKEGKEDEEGDEEEEEEEEEEDEEEEEEEEDWDNRPLYLPPLPPFKPPPAPHRTFDLNGRRLQVIVKLANIILTPEKPEYKGGVWHVEGMKNEQIVSSGIYYYESENISESRLHFRVSIEEPSYEQGDDRGVREVYGFASEDPLNQQLGNVITQSGRSIAFPNLYQHQVAPFSLADPSKPGHRKILVFFLVDPNTYITSTINVPPQQPSWRQETLNKYRPWSTLPDHAMASIVEHAAYMTKEDAFKYREELMKERKFFVAKNSEEVYERPFSLCEH